MSVLRNFKLSYESVILDSEDLRILDSGQWFNDKLLTFIGEFLMNNTTNFEAEKRMIHVFTPPETEMIRHSGSEEEVEMYFGMLEVSKVPDIAFILNNNQDVTRVNGGSHWSLLVFDRKTDHFYHFDSSNGHNQEIAKNLAEKSRKLVGQNQKSSVIDEMCLQQTNSSDCGLYVANFLAELAEEQDVKAIERMKKIEKNRSFWIDLIVNFKQ